MNNTCQETSPENETIDFEAQCKICKKPLIVQIMKIFMDTGHDPQSVLPMATCTRCYDLMVRRDKITDRIKVNCEFLIVAKHLEVDDKNRVFRMMQDLTKEYAKVIADYHNAEPPPWNDAYSRMLMEKPDHWPNTLNSYRNTIKVTMQRPLIDEIQHDEPPQDA
jgi:hypothetical protein